MPLKCGDAAPCYSQFQTGQLAITGAAAAVLLGNPISEGLIRLTNSSDTTIYYGGTTTVDATHGVPLAPGASVLIFCSTIYVFCASTKTVAWEMYL